MKIRKLISFFLIPKPIRTLRNDFNARREIIRRVLKDYGWLRALKEKKSIDKDGNPLPWFSYPAIDFLSQLNFSDKEVFEYGCGFSTLFWGARAKSVFSVESDLKWIGIIEPQLPANCKLIPTSLEIEEYAGKIAAYQKFDIIVIDGYIRTRTACCELSLKHLKPGGIIILDNSDRCLKSAGILRNAGLIQSDFTGFSPLNSIAQTTTVFFSRDYNFEPLDGYQPHKSVAQPHQPFPNA